MHRRAKKRIGSCLCRQQQRSGRKAGREVALEENTKETCWPRHGKGSLRTQPGVRSLLQSRRPRQDARRPTQCRKPCWATPLEPVPLLTSTGENVETWVVSCGEGKSGDSWDLWPRKLCAALEQRTASRERGLNPTC